MRTGSHPPDRAPRRAPVPFTTGWDGDGPAPGRPRRLPIRSARLPGTLPPWLPTERVITAALVLVVVLATATFASAGGGQRDVTDQVPPPTEVAVVTTPPPAELAVVDATATVGATTADPTAVGQAPGEAAGVASTGLAGDQVPVVPLAHDQDGDGLLPANRIVAVYGYPTDANMGVLGEYGVDDIQGLYDEVLMPLVAQWEAADPSRPVIPAFEVIFGVAQGTAQADGSWLGHGSYDDVQRYIDFAAERDMVVLVDTQMGTRTIEQEVEYLMPLLEQPNVHLAIDPEFAVDEGEVPGEVIGRMDASEINRAQELMAELSASAGLPGKIVMVHQFYEDMIGNNDQLADVLGVELVIHADGHGAPSEKETTYNIMVTQWIETIPFFAGFKVWLDNDGGFGDEPRLEPADMMSLNPAPDIVTYQ